MKPMSRKLRHIAMFSGNTILGDGSVIMILDPERHRQAASARARRQPSMLPTRRRCCTATPKQREPRCWCSAPARTRPRRCRCRWSRGSRRSTPQRSKCRRPPAGAVSRPPDAAGAASRDGESAARARSRAGVLRRRRSMGLVVDEIVDIVEDASTSRSAADARRPRLGGHPRPGDRDHRYRPLPAARLRRLVPPARTAQPAQARHACCWSTTRLLPQHAGAGAAGRRLRGRRRSRERAGGARPCSRRPRAST